MSPQRIQRKRTKGWRMPEGAVYVGRPSKWGNPLEAGKVVFLTGPKCGHVMTRADAAEAYANAYRNGLMTQEFITAARRELAGKDLACWCPEDQPCHADVLLQMANEGND